MTPLIFDLIIVSLVLLSLLLGFMRGFVNEVFTIIGWIAAVLATIYFTPVVSPFAEQMIKKAWLAKLAASSGIFIATLAIFSVTSHLAVKTLEGSKLSIVDRIMGFAFGGLRAVVLLGLGFLLFAYIYEPDKRPDFVQDARSRPFLEASAKWVQTVVPGLDKKVQISADDAPPAGVAKPKDNDPAKPEETSAAKDETKPETASDIKNEIKSEVAKGVKDIKKEVKDAK